eukprot:365338-Chlamydomonas_euryale.AAC.24
MPAHPDCSPPICPPPRPWTLRALPRGCPPPRPWTLRALPRVCPPPRPWTLRALPRGCLPQRPLPPSLHGRNRYVPMHGYRTGCQDCRNAHATTPRPKAPPPRPGMGAAAQQWSVEDSATLHARRWALGLGGALDALHDVPCHPGCISHQVRAAAWHRGSDPRHAVGQPCRLVGQRHLGSVRTARRAAHVAVDVCRLALQAACKLAFQEQSAGIGSSACFATAAPICSAQPACLHLPCEHLMNTNHTSTLCMSTRALCAVASIPCSSLTSHFPVSP